MKDVLVTLISICLGVAAVFGVPFLLMAAYLGLSGQFADVGRDENVKLGAVYLAIAVVIVLAIVGWFKVVVVRK